MIQFKNSAISALFLQISLLCLITTAAEGAQVNEVWHEAKNFESAQLETFTTLPESFNSSNTLMLITQNGGRFLSPTVKNGKKFSGGEGPGRIGLHWSDSQTIRIFRERADESSGAQMNVNLQLAGFKNGMKVQSGVSVFDQNSIEKEISIESVRLDAAFPIILVSSDDWFANQSEAFTFTASFPNENTLKLIRNDAPEGDREANASQTKVFWQVVEFMDGALVRSGTIDIPYYSDSIEVELSDSPIQDLSKAFLVFTYAAGLGADGVEGLISTRGMIENERLIQFKRAKKGSKSTQGVNIVWYLVELRDEASLVQKGSEHFEALDFSRPVALKPIDPTRSIVLISSSGGIGPKEGKEATDFMSNQMFQAQLNGDSELYVSRFDDPELLEVEADLDWFVIEFPPITIATPQGGEVYRVGNHAEIAWHHASSLERGGKLPDGSHSLSLFLSTNEGEDKFPLKVASKIPAHNDAYSWLVPERIDQVNLIGNKLRMKILDMSLKERNESVSHQNFAIKGDLKLVSPNGNQVWRVSDQDKEIVWNYQGAIGTVSIYYDLESGYHADSFSRDNSFAKKISVGLNGIGSFSLASVPDFTCKTVKVKIVQDSDPTVYDISRNDFSILPVISIVSPGIERDKWTAQTNQVIKWKTKGTINSFDLYYSTESGKKWDSIVRNYSKGFDFEYSYLWQVPIESIGKLVLIKVEKSGMKDVFGVSSTIEEEALQIVPWIEIMKPKMDQILDAGRPSDVVWRLNGDVEYLQIESSLDAGKSWNKEGVVVATADNYQWVVPNIVTNQVMLRLIDTSNNEHQAVSTTFHTSGTLEILSPNGGESFKRAEPPIIRWKKSQGMGTVSIWYSTDGGLNYPESNRLISGVTAESWTWTELPYIFNHSVRIRIVSDEDPSIFDESDKSFSITASSEKI